MTAMVGTFATVTGSMLVDESPEPISVTVMVKLSGPRVVLLSVKDANALLMSLKVPVSVMVLPVTGVEPDALNTP